MLSVGRIYAGGGEGGVANRDESTKGARRRAPGGWRYLWEQVAEGAEDYYSADVARGEAAGRWGGSAAGPELGLAGQVTEEQMERVFGLLMHPSENEVLGQGARQYRSLEQRLEAAGKAHREAWTAEWAQREMDLVAAGAGAEAIEGELATHRERAAEGWSEVEARIRRGGERAAVAGFDLTCSPPKSVSVLWAAADADGREAIWRAHREGVTAALGYIEREAAWSRVGYNGVRQVDTTGMVIASFDHRMSRHGDTQIHTHNAVLNRVRCDDGQWRALDGRAVYQVAASAGAIYDRVREAALERELGVRHEQRKPDGPREIVGVDDEMCRLFSSRRIQVEGRLAEMVAAYTQRHGAEPSQWAVAQMSQWATLETRSAKERTETTEEALARWEAQSRDQLGRSLAGVWDQAMAAGTAEQPARDPVSDDEALAQAIAAVDAEKSTWTRYDLARQLTLALHVDRDADGVSLLARVDRLVDSALGATAKAAGVVKLSAPAVFETPAALRRRSDDGSVYEQHGAERFSTDEGVARELRVLAAARRADGPAVDAEMVERCLAAETSSLSPDQAQAARQVLTSGRNVEVLVGPAGTGKTHTMGAVGRVWRAAGGDVKGLAVAETAARTLAEEADIATANTAKLLFEHRYRSAKQKAQPAWQERWAIKAGSLVILDEAAMASRQVIDDVAQLCQAAGAKLLLVGDHEQLASPAAGGTFALLVDQVGAARLAEVRRFSAEWERRASLRLRAGDASVLADYDMRARIVGGDEADMEDAAFAAAVADRARGLRPFLLADTNEQAARLAGRVREQLVRSGAVDDSRSVRLDDGNWAGVGDRVVTRQNDRKKVTDGRFVANRDVWEVTAIHDDGAVSAARVDHDNGEALGGQRVRLEADYVGRHVQLEYAGTVHAAQGGTRGVAHAIISERTSRQALYVALSRGVEDNRAYVVCHRPDGTDMGAPIQDPLSVLAAILERNDQPDELSAMAFREQSAEQVRSLGTLFPIWQDLCAEVSRERWKAAVAAVWGDYTADAMVAGDAWPTLAARLRVIDMAGLDSAATLANAAAGRDLDDADDVAAVLHWRLRHVEVAAGMPIVEGGFTQISPTDTHELAGVVAQVAAAMDARSEELGARVQTDRPAWAAELGPIPDDGAVVAAGVDWRRRAGIVAGYREAFGLPEAVDDDDVDPIGPMPTLSRADALAWWQRAAVALHRIEAAGLADVADERLEAVVDQARQADAQAPPAVAEQLRRVSADLREARTAHGEAIASDGPASTAALEAAQRTDTLSAVLEQLEAGQRRREVWRQASSRLQTQATLAAAELAARAAARVSAPFWETDLSTLRSELDQVEQRLITATTVAQRHETLSGKWQGRADQLTAKLAGIATGRPQVSIAEATVASERAAAARLDELDTVLDRGRLKRVRGAAREDLTAERVELVKANPALVVEPAGREQRWTTMLDRAAAAERRRMGELRAQIDDATVQAADNAAIAGRARAEIDQLAQRATTLRDEIERRSEPIAQPHPPWPPSQPHPASAPPVEADGQPDPPAPPPQRHPAASPPVEGDVADRYDWGPVRQPAPGQVVTAVAEHDVVPGAASPTTPTTSVRDPIVTAPADDRAARADRRVGLEDSAATTELAGDEAVVDDDEHNRRRVMSVAWDMDLDTLRATLAHAEQQLSATTYVIEHYGTVRQQWQDTADGLHQKLDHLADSRPYTSIAETNVAIERAAAGRIDEIRSELGQSRMGRPALRGAAREELAEELNGLINANPALRFDPVLREDRWSTIVERANTTEQRQMVQLRTELDEALANVADNATIVSDAAAGLGEQTQLCSTLRAVLDARTNGLADGAEEDTSAVASAASPEEGLSVTAAESAKADPVVAGTVASPVSAVRHEQMQLPVDPPAITEGLGL